MKRLHDYKAELKYVCYPIGSILWNINVKPPCVVPTPNLPPPRPQLQQLTFQLSSEILRNGKASLKSVRLPAVKSSVRVGKVVEDCMETWSSLSRSI